MIKRNLYYILMSTIVLLIADPNESYSKGRSGTYLLKGFALSQTGDTLKNHKLVMYWKDKVDTLITDSKGYYETKIHWATACPSGSTFVQTRRVTKRYNPKYIYFSSIEVKIKIKNDWERFAYEDHNSGNHMKEKNLIF